LQLLLRQCDDLAALQTETRNHKSVLSKLPAVPEHLRAPLAAVRTVLAEQIAVLDEAIRRRVAPRPSPRISPACRPSSASGC